MKGTEVYTQQTGLSVGGQSLVLTYDSGKRHYDGSSGHEFQGVPEASSFGRFWMSSLHKSLVVANQIDVNLLRGNGTVVRFVYGYSNGVKYYPADAEIKSTLVSLTDGGYLFTDASTGIMETYSATGSILSAADTYGNTLAFSYSGGNLTQVIDSVGRKITFEYTSFEYLRADLPAAAAPKIGWLISKVTDSAGQSILATYNSNTFNSNKMLSKLTWPDGKAKSFVYESSGPDLTWALTGVIDENNSRFATINYDALGRANHSELAGGVDWTTVDYGPTFGCGVAIDFYDAATNVLHKVRTCQLPSSASPPVVINAAGVQSALSSAMVVGRPIITGNSQAAGSGCSASVSGSTFDISGNVSSKDDFKGTRTCFAYDTSNRETVRVEGVANTLECTSVLPANAVLQMGARRITTSWHPDWRLPAVITAPGSISTTVYQGQPDPFASNAVANCTSAPLLPNGKALPVVCKQVAQEQANFGVPPFVSSDPQATNVSVLLHGDAVFEDTSSSRKTVTPTGNASISTAASVFGGSSIYIGGAGAYVTVANAGGNTFWTDNWTTEFWVKNGLDVLGSSSIFGNRTQSGGHLFVTYSAGQLTSINFEISSSGAYIYPSVNTSTAGFTAARSAAGAFNHIAVTKVDNVLTFFLNGKKLSAVTVGTLSNTTTTQMYIGAADASFYPYNFTGWIDDFRITKNVARYTADFVVPTSAYPDASQATKLPPTFNGTFTYDAAGRTLTQTDTQGRTSNYSYFTDSVMDGQLVSTTINPNAKGHFVGDLQSVTLPGGFTTTYDLYDPAGRLLKMTDPKGVVTDITYTPRGWVKTVSTTAPGQTARLTTYSYDGVGQMIGVASPDGTALTYTYDPAHRLTGITDARGNTVTYTLDNMGNRTGEAIKDPSGTLQRSISRSFDALNRVQQVTGAPR